jgi:1A family penicillin-binding protein
MAKRKRRFKKSKTWLLFGAVVAAVGAVSLMVYAESRLSKLVLGGLGEGFSTKVYSAPYTLVSDVSFIQIRPSPDQLVQRLTRLAYSEVVGEPNNPGEFSWSYPILTVYLRAFETPHVTQDEQRVRLRLLSDQQWQILDPEGRPLEQIFFQPELIAELSGTSKVRRDPTEWDEIPVSLRDAVVAVEDTRFYRHWGVNPRAIVRAAWNNLRGRSIQGGSTITQQLAKNLFLSPERTFQRKFAEAFLAFYLEFRFTKEKILTLYLNHIYLGQDGFISVAGVKSAAEFYFQKPLRDLTLSETALLAGLIRSPYRYNPFRDINLSKKRRDFVLRRMRDLDLITKEEFSAALATRVHVRPTSFQKSRNQHDYYVAEVVRQLSPKYSEDMIFRYGLKIHTAVDPILQHAAQRAARLAAHQVALVAMNPANGHVVALVGGKDFEKSQFNRATQAIRQPGSAFKPFVYGAALEGEFTPATLINDELRLFKDEKGRKWSPKNVDGVYYGPVPLRDALSLSLNGATLDLAGKVGPKNIVNFAVKMGIRSPLEPSLAIALGASEVTLTELVAAYAPFNNGGFQVIPIFVTSVLDSENSLLEIWGPERQAVIEPALSFLMTSLLQTTVMEGTARSLAVLGWSQPSAGKTGTTNDGKDAWFIGYTPELLAGVWSGLDDAKAAGLTGARNALPIWADFMSHVYAKTEAVPFKEPEGIVSIKIDPTSGLLWQWGCPTNRHEFFISGSEPKKKCPLHAAGFKGLFKRLFGK